MSKPAAEVPAGRPCVLYLRCSSGKQEDSVPDQRKHLHRFAEEQGFEILDEFVDDGISGTSADGRAAFQRMIAEAQGKPRFRVILTYSTSRFSRADVDETGFYRHILRQAGVEVIYVADHIQDEETEELVRPMLQTLARR